jgi:hypothetical protein
LAGQRQSAPSRDLARSGDEHDAGVVDALRHERRQTAGDQVRHVSRRRQNGNTLAAKRDQGPTSLLLR